MFWVLALLVALGTAALMALPLVRHDRHGARRLDYDLAVYKDQLAEIDRDLERGLLTADQAQAASVEIQRRMLAAAAGAGTASADDDSDSDGDRAATTKTASLAEADAAARPGTLRRLGAAGLLLGVPGAAVLVYLTLGSPGMPDVPYAARMAGTLRMADGSTPLGDAARIEALRAAVAANPTDPQGHLTLARNLIAQGKVAEAVVNTRAAADLAPDDPRIWSEHGQVLVMAARGGMTREALTVFLKVLQMDRTEPRARFFLGLARVQQGDTLGALAIWRDLTADTPNDAAWAPVLAEQIDRAAASAGADPITIPPRHPLDFPTDSWTLDDSGAGPAAGAARTAGGGGGGGGVGGGMTAEGLSEGERTSIEAMVESLAQQLKDRPQDFDGWMMLARSQRVLERFDEAVAAYGKAVELKPEDMEARRGLAHALIARSQARGETDPPAALFPVMRSILADDPENQEALFFLGLEAAASGKTAQARGFWTRLLAQLPQGDPLAEQIRTRMESLPGE